MFVITYSDVKDNANMLLLLEYVVKRVFILGILLILPHF